MQPCQNYREAGEEEQEDVAYGEGDGALGWRSWRHRQTAVMVSTDREVCYDSPPTSTSVEGPPPEWSVVISGKQGPVSSSGSGPHS